MCVRVRSQARRGRMMRVGATLIHAACYVLRTITNDVRNRRARAIDGVSRASGGARWHGREAAVNVCQLLDGSWKRTDADVVSFDFSEFSEARSRGGSPCSRQRREQSSASSSHRTRLGSDSGENLSPARLKDLVLAQILPRHDSFNP
jgi:hypothetical protein